jgi:hypothetical protein
MKYRSILKYAFGPLVCLGTGTLISEIIGFVAIGLAIIVILIWLLFPRMANPILENIKKQLEMEVLEVVTDAKYNRTKLVLKIMNTQPKGVSIKAFSNTLVKLDAEKVSDVLIVDTPIKLEQPSTTIVAYIDILRAHVEQIRSKNGNEKEYWQFETNCLLDTKWGEIVWQPIMKCINQSPRVGNIVS